MPGSIVAVYTAWVEGQENTKRLSLTSRREQLIARALTRYSADQLVLFIRYAYESNEKEARFWRGEEHASTGRTYMKLENLFRVTKLPGRIERAREWAENLEYRELEEGVELSPIGHMRTRHK